MTLERTSISGRPTLDEYAPYAAEDVAYVHGEDIVGALEQQGALVVSLLNPLTEEEVRGRRYAPGKWTIKEVLGHLIDDERIYAYRLLCIARADTRPLAGFDENAYVAATDFESQPLEHLRTQYQAVRASTIALLASLQPDEWSRRGTANDHSVTVRGLAFHIAGHELRHYRALRERYLIAPAS